MKRIISTFLSTRAIRSKHKCLILYPFPPPLSSIHSSSPYLIPHRTSFSYPSPRHLDEIVHTSKLSALSTGELSVVWLAHHNIGIINKNDKKDSTEYFSQVKNQHILGGILTKAKYQHLKSLAKANPFFILPVFKSSHVNNTSIAYEMFLFNFQDNYVLVTPLAQYQQSSSVTPSAVMTFYDNYADTHDTVLIRMELVGVGLNREEGERTMSHLLDFYTEVNKDINYNTIDSNEQFKSIKNYNSMNINSLTDYIIIFNHYSNDFNVELFVSEVEKREKMKETEQFLLKEKAKNDANKVVEKGALDK